MKTINQMIQMSKTQPTLYSKIFPYLDNFSVRDFNNPSQIIIPLWYNYLFPNSLDNMVENIARRKYGSLFLYDDYFDVTSYKEEYHGFCTRINDSMTHYYRLFTTEYNPYDNVFENRTETHEYGKKTETTDFGAETTTNTTGNRTNTNTYGESTETTVNQSVPQNTTSFVDRDKEINTNDSHIDTEEIGGGTDTTTTNAKTDKKTNDAYTDLMTVDRHGNIGTTMTQEMGERELSYANKLKLADLFLKEWIDFFSIGVWDDGKN